MSLYKLSILKTMKEENRKKESQTEENSGQNVPVHVTGSTSGSSADGKMPHLAVLNGLVSTGHERHQSL